MYFKPGPETSWDNERILGWNGTKMIYFLQDTNATEFLTEYDVLLLLIQLIP